MTQKSKIKLPDAIIAATAFAWQRITHKPRMSDVPHLLFYLLIFTF